MGAQKLKACAPISLVFDRALVAADQRQCMDSAVNASNVELPTHARSRQRFAAQGATFLRPIPNFDCLWQWGDIAVLTLIKRLLIIPTACYLPVRAR